MPQKDYKISRHDKLVAIIHWELCKKYGFPNPENSYMHQVDRAIRVLENNEAKLLWDFSIQTERKIDLNKPDILLPVKQTKTCFIIDVACPFDNRILNKEREKINVYTDLKYEILKCLKGEVKKLFIIPIIVGALGLVTKNLRPKINVEMSIKQKQKVCLLGTARILRKALDC